MAIEYQLVSEGAILRDYVTPKYVNEEHKMLVDIADSFWQAGITEEYLKEDYKALYNRYGKKFWSQVFEDMGAIESQIDGHEQELVEEYNELLARLSK